MKYEVWSNAVVVFHVTLIWSYFQSNESWRFIWKKLPKNYCLIWKFSKFRLRIWLKNYWRENRNVGTGNSKKLKCCQEIYKFREIIPIIFHQNMFENWRIRWEILIQNFAKFGLENIIFSQILLNCWDGRGAEGGIQCGKKAGNNPHNEKVGGLFERCKRMHSL